jgi:hypothetical protein
LHMSENFSIGRIWLVDVVLVEVAAGATIHSEAFGISPIQIVFSFVEFNVELDTHVTHLGFHVEDVVKGQTTNQSV